MLATTGLVPCIIRRVGLFFIPESPRWLVGREKQFEIALRRLHRRHVSLEAAESRNSSNLLKVFQRLEFKIFSRSALWRGSVLGEDTKEVVVGESRLGAAAGERTWCPGLRGRATPAMFAWCGRTLYPTHLRTEGM